MAPGYPASLGFFGGGEGVAPPLIRGRVSAVGGMSLSVWRREPHCGWGLYRGWPLYKPRLQGVRAGPPELSFLNTKEDSRDPWHANQPH